MGNVWRERWRVMAGTVISAIGVARRRELRFEQGVNIRAARSTISTTATLLTNIQKMKRRRMTTRSSRLRLFRQQLQLRLQHIDHNTAKLPVRPPEQLSPKVKQQTIALTNAKTLGFIIQSTTTGMHVQIAKGQSAILVLW